MTSQRRAAEEDELDRRIEDISYDEANPVFDIYPDEDQEEVTEFVFDDQGKPTFIVNKSVLKDIGEQPDFKTNSNHPYLDAARPTSTIITSISHLSAISCSYRNAKNYTYLSANACSCLKFSVWWSCSRISSSTINSSKDD
ncbi:hypothetical protein CDL15_Pgr010862 [Punica granatum]|uniref:Uncharacterized protein n=1 Tax=Punica granatum TaxID=22663 RepID=A0A218W4X2_PUNGR|nr:hypothetical protein CDL15_Pgr010862 [Punica granatum]